MAKVIVTAIGSAGDVHPLLGVSRALAARGHDVVFCTHAPFEAAVRASGFAFVPVGTAEAYAQAMADPALWDPRTSFRTLWRVIAPVLRPHFDTLRALSDADTVLVGTLWAFSARLMQERFGARYVSVQVSPSTLLSAHAPPTHKRLTIPKGLPLAVKAGLMTLIERQVLDRVCGPELNAARRALGLAPARRILGRWLHSTDGVLCLFPSWFAPAQPDWPANHLQSGFALFNDVGPVSADAELDAFVASGEAPVVFTAGSTLVDGRAYERAVTQVLRATGVRGILLAPDAPAASDGTTARGHDVVFCTHAPFEAAVRASGFAFVPVGTAEAYAQAMADPALWDPRTSFRTLWRVIAPVLRPHFDTLRALSDADTVLVGTLWAFSARLMQERFGARYVSVQVSPSTLLSAHAPPTHKRLTIPKGLPLAVKAGLMTLIERQVLDRVCGPELNAARRALGLAPARRILGRWLHSTDGVLCLFPPWFAPAQPDWPANHLQSGFALFNDVGPVPADAELDAFVASGEAPVVFTAGSTLVDGRAYERAVTQVLRATGVRGILLAPDAPAASDGTTGPRERTAETTARANGAALLKRRYVPLAALLPRCRALVHHGGIGTASLAYAAGVPQVVTPFAHDQFDNAQRVAASGCGVRLDAPVRGEPLARALARVLGDAAMAARCAEVRARMAAQPDGCDEAARFIERFAPGVAARQAQPA
ncbi:rhamnosyltransferase I, subunit B [Burkholderia pseudomallei]|nr:rhamnosyltransferase I, subunit B [Burkholderia pseudomallei]